MFGKITAQLVPHLSQQHHSVLQNTKGASYLVDDSFPEAQRSGLEIKAK